MSLRKKIFFFFDRQIKLRKYFLMGQSTNKMYYSQKKYTTKQPGNIQGVYNKGTAKKEANGPRKPTIPKNHLYPIQVKKSIKDLSLSPLYTLEQYHKLQMNERFILWAKNVSLSKATQFLSPQTVQKRQRGAAL